MTTSQDMAGRLLRAISCCAGARTETEIEIFNAGKDAAALITKLSEEKVEAVKAERAFCVQVMRGYVKAFENTISSMPSTKLKHRAEGMSHGAKIIADRLASIPSTEPVSPETSR